MGVAVRASAQELDAVQRAAIDAGRQVVVSEKVPGSSWPRVTVYQFFPGSTEEAAAVFADYERHVSFMPNVKQSRISRTVDSVTVEVDYVLNVPIVSDESYTVRDHLTSSGPDSGSTARSYRVEWTLVRASSTKAADGEARFEPRRDGTLMTYRNLVVPGSRLAGLGFIRNRAQREVAATARAIGDRVAKQRLGDRSLLDRQVQALRVLTGAPESRQEKTPGAR
jgi:hypothetical protein